MCIHVICARNPRKRNAFFFFNTSFFYAFFALIEIQRKWQSSASPHDTLLSTLRKRNLKKRCLSGGGHQISGFQSDFKALGSLKDNIGLKTEISFFDV